MMQHAEGGAERREAAGAPLAPPLLVIIVVLGGFGLALIAPLALPDGRTSAFLALPPAIAAVALFWTAAGALARAQTAVIPYEPTTAIVTSGPYRFTRNPIYVAFLLIQISLAFAFSNGWLLILLPLSWYLLDVVQVRREERYLVRMFGETYLAYARRVRRWL
jgi:protein-S-isoprenylcysteine O-methyltransferase Ste14